MDRAPGCADERNCLAHGRAMAIADAIWPVEVAEAVAETLLELRPCGCRTEDGVFIACADHS